MPNASRLVRERLAGLIAQRERVLAAFLEDEKHAIALACHAMARRFGRGGTLIAFGTGAAASDAAHVAVEFMHPVIVGKRALPALAPTNDPTGSSTLVRLGRPDDIALGIVHGADDPAVREFLRVARRRGLLSLALTGEGAGIPADHTFVVPSDDPAAVQEVQETLYHVLWELVHVFFDTLRIRGHANDSSGEHDVTPRLSAPADACITCGDVAVEARVVAVREETATIEKDGAREEVAVELVDGVSVGDILLCHAGVALERLDGVRPLDAAAGGGGPASLVLRSGPGARPAGAGLR